MASRSPAVPGRPAGTAGLSRRGFLAASAAGLALLAAGCTADPAESEEPVTAEQVDSLAAQVAVQQAVVAAYATAGDADAELATEVADLAAQAGEQLTRLRAASPNTDAPGTPSASASASPTAVGDDVRGWLRTQVTEAAGSHADACREQSGARAALLGSIAAGLRGQATVLA